MVMVPLPGPPAVARRELRKEEMTVCGSTIEWLRDPDLIPEAATTAHMEGPSGAHDNPYFSLGVWMSKSFAEWSAEAHPKLSYESIFTSNALPNADRVAVRDSIREDAEVSYGTGIMAMSEIFEVVPRLALREGIREPADWAEIASSARLFGRALGYDGTNPLTLVRAYLLGGHRHGNDITRYEPGKLKLDEETGITTVTPLDKLIKTALSVVEGVFIDEGHHGACIGFQAVPEGVSKKSMFDVVWDAFGSVVARRIYPYKAVEAAGDIPSAEAPDENLHSHLETRMYQLVRQFS